MSEFWRNEGQGVKEGKGPGFFGPEKVVEWMGQQSKGRGSQRVDEECGRVIVCVCVYVCVATERATPGLLGWLMSALPFAHSPPAFVSGFTMRPALNTCPDQCH